MEICHGEQPEMMRYWVWLAQVFGAGSTKLLSFLPDAESPQEICEAVRGSRQAELSVQQRTESRRFTLDDADRIVHFCRSSGIELLPINSSRYPGVLRSIPSPPVLLTACGNTELLDNPLSLAVVGTRHPSPYTERVTSAMVGPLAQQGFTIVSGFAIGVDSIAHRAALDNGGSTIAVLGCGVNVDYPRGNDVLRSRMISSGKGLLLSEYLPGTQAYPANFPRRNRILSGLSYATAVMEAAMRSGSLLTAQCAVEQGRYLYCVPPADLFDDRYSGVIPLLRDGAIPLMNYKDILLAFYSKVPQYISLENAVQPSRSLIFAEDRRPPAAADAKKPKPAAKPETADFAEIPPEPAKPEAPAQTAPAEREAPLPDSESGQAIVSYLRAHGDVYADDIAAALDMDLSLLLSELTMLELDGFVESLFGKVYRALPTA